MCKRSLCLVGLTIAFGLMAASQAPAQILTNRHGFSALDVETGTNSDGVLPIAGLALSGDFLYGVAFTGGGSGNGTVFAVKTNGTGFTNLHDFTATSGLALTNDDGAQPEGTLILSGSFLYGTAFAGGTSGTGALFALNTNGTGFTNIHNFTAISSPNSTNDDGANPAAGLLVADGVLYGTTMAGGNSGFGTVFKVNTDGTGFTVLHHFAGGNDGAIPVAGLVMSGSSLYGVAEAGGGPGVGTVFEVDTNGNGFTTLYEFTGADDGASPQGGLVLTEDALYGTASSGGVAGNGTIYRISTTGTNFTVLHDFNAATDGASPLALLTLSSNTLYGTAAGGGSSGNGTIFMLGTNGADFTTLYHFSGGADGSSPYAALVLSGTSFWGTTAFGGDAGNGTVFELSVAPAPLLGIVVQDTEVILSWPGNAWGYSLQSTTNLVPPVVWQPVAPDPVIVDGQYTVTNTIIGPESYYQLVR